MSLPPVLFSLLMAVGVNLLVFIPAYKYQTDKLTDVTYGFSFALVALSTLFLYGDFQQSYYLLMGLMPLLWAVRLGSYLLIRVLRKGKDNRFDDFRQVWWKFGGFWLLQGVSVWLISLPFVVALSITAAQASAALSSVSFPIGLAIFLFGFLVEAVADWQKFTFRNSPANDGKFMSKGLYSIIRFPNYAGEILVWVGIFIAATPILEGFEWLAIIGPLWIVVLLLFVSGVPTLEKANEEKYGHLAAFQRYREETDKLLPGVY